jgi:iron complex outermembrane receptor protein
MLLTKLKYALSTVMLMLLVLTAFSQSKNGTIRGTVRTSDGVPAEMVSVFIKGVASTTADRNGNYVLKGLPAGNYTIMASLVGVSPTTQRVTVSANETTELVLTLNASNQQLKEVVVTGGKTNKFAFKESEFVAKMPLKNLENPQVYAVISKELMADQIVTNFDDALKNAPGVDKLWSSTGRAGDGAGYFSLRGFAVQPTLVNGLPGLTNGSLDISNVERIEVIKGPSGTLFGSSLISYGGLINTVTKQPFDAVLGEVSLNVGSYGLIRVTADVNTPLDKQHKLLFRVNAAFQNQNTFQDAGFRDTRFIAPSLSYKVNDRLSFTLNTQFLKSKSTNATSLFFDRGAPLKTTTLEGLAYDRKKSYTSDDIAMKNPVSSAQGQMNYKISDSWNSQTVVSVGTAKSDGFYSYLYEGSQFVQGYPNVPSTFGRYITNQNANTKTTDIQQNFTGDFNLGTIRNRMVVGLDYFNRTAYDKSSGYAAAGVVTTGPNGMDTGILTYDNIYNITNATGYNDSKTTQETYSAYGSDVINITPELSAMLSLRVDHFKNGGFSVAEADRYSQTSLSPKFGVVYQVLKDRISVFGNYMNGFTNVAPVNIDNNGSTTTRVFDPEHANQWETGIKTDLFDGKLSGSISYYDIRVSNTVLSVGQNDYTQGGENYSRGLELQVNANPLPGFNIIAGYAKNKSKLAAGPADYLGRRSEGAGPEDQVNAWFSYKIMDGDAKGLGFGFGGNYSGKNLILNRATTGVFALPAYTVLNASVSYARRHYTIGFKMNNLTDKEYYKGWSTLEPMNPRNVVGSVTYKF